MFKLFLSLLAMLFNASVWGCDLLVRVEDYAAQSHRDENQQWQGIDIELTKTLLAQAGCRHRFVPIPWGRALVMLENGELDMMLSVSKTEVREKFAAFVGPQRVERIRVVSKANPSVVLKNFADILNTQLPLGIQEGAFYGAKFSRFMREVKSPEQYFFKVPNNDTKLSLLIKGRIFGFLEEQLNVEYEIKHQLAPKDVFIHPLIINEAPVYFALSKKSVSPEHLKQIKKAFETLDKSDVFKQILNASQH